MIFEDIFTDKKYRYPSFNGRYSFSFNQAVDDRPYKANQNYDIGVRILTPPWYEGGNDDLTLRMVSGQKNEVLVALPNDAAFLDEIRQYLKIEKFLRLNTSTQLAKYETIKEAKRVEMRERKYQKNIWLCISSSKYGKKNCPESKGIAEEVLESAFVESYRMITNDHKDVLEEFLQRTEEELHSDATLQEIDRVKKELKQLDQKMQRLLEMHLEQQIDFGTYEDKKLEIIKEQQLKTTELKRLQGEADVEKDLLKRLDAMRKLLSEAPILKKFD